MSAEGWSGDADVVRWEALEAESRERLDFEAKNAERPKVDWDADGPSWKQDPPAGDSLRPPVADSGPETRPDGRTDGVAPEILLADADHAVAASIEKAMTDRGWIVRRVDNGELALVEFLRLAPHCFVFDYSLPGIGGLDLLRKLSEFGVLDQTRLVVNSAHTQAIYVQRALAMGAHRFLDRPLRSPHELVDAVAGQLQDLGILGPGHELDESEPSAPPAVAEPVPVPSPPQSPARGPAAPTASPDDEAEQPPPPPARPDESRPYRSAFGSGGGPPGRIPKLS